MSVDVTVVVHDGVAYPEKHDRGKENRRLGSGEDQVARDFENDILT